MGEFIKYNSKLTSVTATGDFDNRKLYGKPEFTGGSTFTTLACGFSGTRFFEGYNFDSVQGVMLSTFGNADLAGLNGVGTYPLTSVSTLSYLSGGATIDPPLNGVFLTVGSVAGTYILNNYNSMAVTFPTISAPGIISIIPINAAGFDRLNVPGYGPVKYSHENQIYVSYE